MDRDADPRAGLLLPAEWNQEDFSVAEMDPEARPRARGTPMWSPAQARWSAGSYQQGTAALERLRSGGQQTVVVQHVQVSEGGQAIVAAEIKAGGRRKRAEGGRGKKMTDEPQDHGWRAHLGLAHAASRCGARRSAMASRAANLQCRTGGVAYMAD